MYTFLDKGGRSVTLRPEGTASIARSFLQNGLFSQPMPIKTFYDVACFRYENKQKGRLREFHQLGVETFGSKGPSIDAEVIALALTFLKRVGLDDLTVHINSIGCPECQKKYNELLRRFRPKFNQLCPTCQSRFERNPLRILDCKSEICQELGKGAPVLLDHICGECRDHFEKFKTMLDSMGITYKIDNGIVRGLDYYTKTVFEIISGPFTICGGGRYDGLIEEFGGDPTPAIGFALGIERLLIRLAENGVEIPKSDILDLYMAPLGENAVDFVPKLVYDLRQNGVSVETDHMARGLKAQMKYADKLGCRFTAVVGDNEIENNIVKIKNMETGEQTEMSFDQITAFLKGAQN